MLGGQRFVVQSPSHGRQGRRVQGATGKVIKIFMNKSAGVPSTNVQSQKNSRGHSFKVKEALKAMS